MMENYKRLTRQHGNITIALCPIRDDDEALSLYLTWMNDEEILQWLGRNNKICSLNEEREYVRQAGKPDNPRLNIVIVEDGKERLIGNCDIKQIDRNAHFGIVIGDKNYRNRGIGTEVIKMLTDFSFDQLDCHRVHLTLNGDNERAHKCYLKAGLVDCGVEHETKWYDGHWADTIHMEKIREY